jgi:hypothetical protein
MPYLFTSLKDFRNQLPEGFCWTKDAGSVTVGLDETG